jgi:hypothetical protein
MNEIYVKAKDLGEEIISEMPKQDLYSLDELLGAMEEIIYNYHSLQEEYDDYKENVKDNYREIKPSVLYGIPESDYDR